MTPLHDKEALRQQTLLGALLGEDGPGVLADWVCHTSGTTGPGFERGLAAYRAHAAALAERALAAAFPTLRQLIGEASFAALARHFWRCHPPLAGDMGLWGEGLPAFVADAASLADEPYLADVARLDWAVHVAERAADATAVQGLELLATLDPAQLRLQLAAGTAIVESPHPVVAIWHAHRGTSGESEGGGDRFAAVRAAFAGGRGESALVFRQGWAPCVRAVAAAEARFTGALLAMRPLGAALQRAGDDFDFEPWLIAALQQRRLLAVAALRLSDATSS